MPGRVAVMVILAAVLAGCQTAGPSSVDAPASASASSSSTATASSDKEEPVLPELSDLFSSEAVHVTHHIVTQHFHPQDEVSVFSLMLDHYFAVIEEMPEATDEEITVQAIRRALADIDPHSTYLIDLSSAAIVGEGVTLEPGEGGMFVSDVRESGPAYLAGLRPDDRVVSIDGTRIEADARPSDVAGLLKGPAGSVVEVEIDRDGTQWLTLIRPGFPADGAPHPELLDDILYYHVPALDLRAGNRLAIWLQQNPDIAGRAAVMVLDLRGNTGGLLSAITHLAGIVAEREDPVWLDGREERVPVEFGQTSVNFEGGLVIAVDERTARGGRYLAELLQALGRGIVVGQFPESDRVLAIRTFIAPTSSQARGHLGLWTSNMAPPPGIEFAASSRPDVPATENPSTRESEILNAALAQARDLLDR